MKQIKIVRALLPTTIKRHQYMSDNGQFDYLGQILVQQGYEIPDKARTPADLEAVIPDFTFNVRGRISDTITTLRILQLDKLERTTHPRKLQEILGPLGYEVIWL